MAILNASGLIQEFASAAQRLGDSCRVRHEFQPAPHKGKALPPGECAVYVFTLSEPYGQNTTAGPNRALKVGKAGLNSNARFQSQHYSPRAAPSTLAAALLKAQILWPFIGVSSLDESNVRAWLEKNTDRDNFYLPASYDYMLGRLETYLKGRLGPVFEGSAQ